MTEYKMEDVEDNPYLNILREDKDGAKLAVWNRDSSFCEIQTIDNEDIVFEKVVIESEEEAKSLIEALESLIS